MCEFEPTTSRSVWYGLAIQATKARRASAGLRKTSGFRAQEKEVSEDLFSESGDEPEAVRTGLTSRMLARAQRAEEFRPNLQKLYITFPGQGESQERLDEIWRWMGARCSAESPAGEQPQVAVHGLEVSKDQLRITARLRQSTSGSLASVITSVAKVPKSLQIRRTHDGLAQQDRIFRSHPQGP